MMDLFLPIIENNINRLIRSDLLLEKEISVLKGKSIAIYFLGVDMGFTLTVLDDANIKLNAKIDENVTTLSASVLDFLYIVKNKDNNDISIQKNIKITGNSHDAIVFANFLKKINIDWERYLSNFIGDVPSHGIFKMLHAKTKMASRISSNLHDNIVDFLHDEIKVIPTKERFLDFSTDVMIIREDVDRLSAKVDRLLIKKR